MSLNYAAFCDRLPPEDSQDASAVFVNRDKELRIAHKQLLSIVARPRKVVMTVMGLARVGKSHFLYELYRNPEIKKEFNAIIRLRLSESPEEIVLLREVWKQVLDELTRSLQQLGRPDVLEPLRRVVINYSPVIFGTCAEVEIAVKETDLDTIQKQVGGNISLAIKWGSMGLPALLGGPAVDGGASMTGSQQTSHTHSSERTFKIKATSFTPLQLRELVGFAHALVRTQIPDWRTLIVIDDFDLIRRSPEGKLQPELLLGHLFQLAQFDGLFVLTTVRKDTFIANRHSFHLLVEVGPLLESEAESILVEIYQRHVNYFHDSESPFSGDFVNAAAKSCDGRIGLFMEILKRAYMDPIYCGEVAQIQQAHFPGYIDMMWQQFRKENSALAEEIRELVVDRAKEALPDELAVRIRNTSLFDAVLEDYSSTNQLVVKRFLIDYLRSMPGTSSN